MASYVAAVLGNGETVLHEGRVAVASYWLAIPFGGLCVVTGVSATIIGFTTPGIPAAFGMIYFVLAALCLVPPILSRKTAELVITNRRIIAKLGILSRRTIELNLAKVESVRVDQGVIGRMLNYGDIHVVGTGGSQQPIPRIAYPLEFRRRLDEVLTKHGHQPGAPVEPAGVR